MEQKIMRFECYTDLAKPLNGSGPKGSKISTMLEIGRTAYEYEGKTREGDVVNRKKETRVYLIKGIKGWIRHSLMRYYQQKGIEVCFTTTKTEIGCKKEGSKIIEGTGRNVLPEGFHPLGACEGKCSIYKIFGGIIAKEGVSSELSQKSKIRIIPNKMVDLGNASKKQREDFMNKNYGKFDTIKLIWDKSTAQGMEGEGLQDFTEQGFSGIFHFDVDVTGLEDKYKKDILKALMETPCDMGRAKTRGSGKINILKFGYGQLVTEKKLKPNGDGFDVITEEKFNPLNEEWQKIYSQ